MLGLALLLASYVLGHFIFMLGGELDPLYDAWRTREHPTHDDTTFQAAANLERRLTPGLPDAFSTLKWSKAYMQVEPGARMEIDRSRQNRNRSAAWW